MASFSQIFGNNCCFEEKRLHPPRVLIFELLSLNLRYLTVTVDAFTDCQSQALLYFLYRLLFFKYWRTKLLAFMRHYWSCETLWNEYQWWPVLMLWCRVLRSDVQDFRFFSLLPILKSLTKAVVALFVEYSEVPVLRHNSMLVICQAGLLT